MSEWQINKKANVAIHSSGLKVHMSHGGEALDLSIPSGFPVKDIRRLTLEAEQVWFSGESSEPEKPAFDPALVTPTEGPRKAKLSLKARK